MTQQLIEIGMRLQAMREINELTTAEMAAKLKMEESDYIAYEKGERDFSFSALSNAADILGVDILDIISGESPKLSAYSLVRSGEGYDIMRRAAYDYKHLAFTFRGKKAEPFLVTVSPKEGTPVLHAHDGQEFNYMLEGEMLIYLGDDTLRLKKGDSVYYDSSVAHAMNAEGGDAKFLAVVMK